MLPGDVDAAVADGMLRRIPGIGPAIFDKIATLVSTGNLPYLDDLRSRFPASLTALYRVPGLGPKKIDVLRERLGIASLAELESACRDGRLAALPGFGAASARKILAGIETASRAGGARLFPEAAALVIRLRDLLSGGAPDGTIEIAGAVRRGCELVESAVLVASADDPRPLQDVFEGLPGSADGAVREGARSRIRLPSGMIAELVVAPPSAFGSTLLAETGAAAHLAGLDSRARGRRISTEARAAEEDVYAALGLPWIAPELREGRGEIEAAESGNLPRLLEPSDVAGLFHLHTTESDGRDTLEEMVAAAAAAGFSYVAITDHSRIAGYAHGLSEERVLEQHAAIEALQPRYPTLRIFKGTEADILPDGSIDFGDAFLARFDIVIASVHSRFDLPENEQTRRVVRAVRNPRVSILGHPTGRLLARREGIRVSMEAVLEAAAESGCAVEINGSPRRLDLDWRWHREAARRGAMLAIGPDAHSVREIDYWRYAVQIARKGWVDPRRLLNSRSAAAVTRWIRSRASREDGNT
jgi:DNA polymerase (family 10)